MILGIWWRFQKDISHFIPYLQGNNEMKVVTALDNLVNDKYTGIFNVTLTAHVMYVKEPSIAVDQEPKRAPGTKSRLGWADHIVPLSASNTSYGYFRVEPDTPLATIELDVLPRNIKRAEIEVYLR
jgi:hypothetical protein